MKIVQTTEELRDWQGYREFLKKTLLLLDGQEPCFISKVKQEFDVEGKPWKGHALLAGKKGILSVKKLKAQGVLFRETTLTRQGKSLTLGPIEPPKLAKEAERLFIKLKLGYKLATGAGTAEPEGGDDGGRMTPAARAETVSELLDIEAELDQLIGALERS